jgi:uncharacterized membrane protein YraQ (UPF0718 family)
LKVDVTPTVGTTSVVYCILGLLHLLYKVHNTTHNTFRIFFFADYLNIRFDSITSFTMAFVQQQQRASLFYLVFCLILAIVAANLRGQDDTLRERATNPTIRDDIRGKTLKELGVVASTTTTEQQQQQQGRRNTQEQLTFNYFSVSLKRKALCLFCFEPGLLQAVEESIL